MKQRAEQTKSQITEATVRYQNRNIFATQWLALAAALLISGSLLAFDAFSERKATLAAESERAQAASTVIQLSVKESFEQSDKVMLALRQEILESGIGQKFNLRLQTLAEAMPLIRSLNVHDSSGTIVASSRPEILGMNKHFEERDYFKQAQEGKYETMFIAPPFSTATNVYTVVLSRKLIDSSGAFAGVITATLDPANFYPLLNSVIYADDMLVSLHHSAGIVFGIAPATHAELIGKNLDKPDSMFLKHRHSGLDATVAQGLQIATGQVRLTAQLDIKQREPGNGQYVTVTVSRLLDDVLAQSKRNAVVKLAIWLVFSVVLLAGMWFHQRRVTSITLREEKAQDLVKVMREEQAQAIVERFELALAQSEQLARTTIDTVPDAICVLDRTGIIIEVNQAWRDFYDVNCDDARSHNFALGTNYLVCELAADANVPEGPLMAQGLAAVLAGERTEFCIEYPCHSPTDKRFFFARLKRFPCDSGQVLIAHGNVTERKKIELELARMAQTDVLTGINNRRHFMQLSETELSRTERHGGPLSVLMIDIDHFKRINDTRGHQVGDTVIQMLATVCKQQLRDLDVVGRLGGEEFAVTMPSADHEQAMQVAERLRQTIESICVPVKQGLPVRFTVSIGLTSLSITTINLDTLLDQADQALYQAKNKGRNQVCSFMNTV